MILDPFKNRYYPIMSVTKVVKGLEGLLTLSIPLRQWKSQVGAAYGLIGSDPFYDKNFERFQSLTTREKEVLKLVALGQTNRQIGELLFISSHTVRTHRNHIWQKLGIRHLAEAIKYAEVFGLV